MIKKISAIAIALILCLSVIVVPASAAKVEVSGDHQLAFALEWDKASYSAGETAKLSVYMTAADDKALATGSFVIGLNSAVISQDDNPIETVKSNAEENETFRSYWKSPTTNLSWLNKSVAPRVDSVNTPEEQSLYNHYLKFTAAKDINGTHANAGNNKDGFYGSEFNPDEPIMTISFVIKSDVPDGTPLNAAITTGSLKSNPVQTTWKYYTNPGNATTAKNVTADEIDISKATATATVGEVKDSSPVQYSKAQIRFHGVKADGDFANYQKQFDVRTVAKISEADFNATFTDKATAKEKITDFGFVYATTSNVPSFDVATAKQVAEGGSADNYVKKSVTYMQHASSGADYIFTCLISDIPDADKTDGVSCLGYVCFDGTYYYFDAAAKADFNTLYTTYFQG